MEENVRICDICGCEIKEEDGTWVDDQFLDDSRRCWQKTQFEDPVNSVSFLSLRCSLLKLPR